LKPEVELAKADLEFVVTLDAIRMKRSTWILESGGQGHFDEASAPPAYKAEFLARGFDMNAESTATRIADSPLRAELVAALDDWAIFEADPALRNAILATARRAQPGPWTDRFRDPITWNNPLKLWWLAEQADPRSLSPSNLVALATLMWRRKLDPVPLLVRAEAIHPDDFLIALSLGQFYFHRNPALSAAHYRAARTLRKENATAWSALGTSLFRSGNHRESLDCFRKAASLNPRDPAHFNNLGVALFEIPDYPAAAAAFREAIRLDPSYANAHFHLGNALVRSKDFAGGEASYREAIRLKPNDSDYWYGLGLALQNQNELKEAAKCYDESLRLNPKNVSAHVNLGNVRLRTDDFNGADACYRKALQLDSTNVNAWYNFGSVHVHLGNLDLAALAFRNVLELNPEDEVARRRLATVNEMLKRRNAALSEAFGITIRAKSE
jgi:tetratricopeptide (TPR) repeat protein